jgi:two-component system, LytTR family, sensor histidine kinase AlgZ
MSISDPPKPSTAAAPHTTLRLPDFCNLGTMLRTLVGANLMVACATLVQAGRIGDWLGFFIDASAIVQPVLIASLLLLCPLTRVFRSYWLGAAVIFTVQLLLVFGMLFFVRAVDARDLLAQLPRYALLSIAATGTMLYYFALRQRAFSPAVTEARLQALQARIRPHFLFNSLTAVLSLIRTEPKRAETALENLADLFRVLMREQRAHVSLAEEVGWCRQYLDIEAIRLGDRLQVEWDLRNMPEEARVPPLMLQPLVENAVHHGVEPGTGPCAVQVKVAMAGSKQVELVVTNPYHGDPPSGKKRGNHMALENIRERLKLHYDVEASLSAMQQNGLYVVRILIPYVRP